MNGKGKRTGGAGYIASVEKPSKQYKVSPRAVFGLVLTLLLPPLGLLFLWHQGVFRTRGRLLLTTLAAVEMTLLVVWLTPHAELTPRAPVPGTPPQVTAAPESDTLNALYNIEQLLYEQQLAEVEAKGGTASDLLTEEQKLELANQQDEATYDITVYSVFGDNAIYYHASKVCRNQTNGQEMTVRDALRKGLQPCPYCNPPTVSS